MWFATELCWALLAAWTSKKMLIMERIYEDEVHEHALCMLKDAIRIEWKHVEDNGCIYEKVDQNSLGELFRWTCPENFGEIWGRPRCWIRANRFWWSLIWRWFVNNLKMMIRENSWGDRRLNTRNVAWVWANLQRTRRILENDNDGCLPEDLVMIASPDSWCWKLGILTWWMQNLWITWRWVPNLIRRLRWICPYSKLVDGTFCNPVMRKNRGCSSEYHAERHILNDTVLTTMWCALIRTWRKWCHCVNVFMRWCNVICDRILLSVADCMHIHEDVNHGKTSLCMFKDAIRIEWKHVEDNGCINEKVENQ